jgi:hypothetical protein
VSPIRSALAILDNDVIVECALSEGSVRPMRVVVLDISAEEPLELLAVPDEGAVQELAPHGADPSLHEGVRDRGTRWGADNGRAAASEDLVERGDELAATVAYQEPDPPVVAHQEVPGSFLEEAGASAHSRVMRPAKIPRSPFIAARRRASRTLVLFTLRAAEHR